MEVTLASSVSFVVFGIVGFAVMGLQESARTSMTQIADRFNSASAVEKVSRIVMEATKVELEEGEGGQGAVHIWTDNQIVWTPETTTDDTEGLLYYDTLNREIRYQADVLEPLEEETLAKNVDAVEFSLVGEAVFLKLTLDYDVDDRWGDGEDDRVKRTVYSSFAVRNNPRVRIGATQ
jgi:hypothetical protein